MSRTNGHAAIAARDLYKSYRLGRVTLEVLKGVTFRVAEGEFGAIVGASGSGKSTLLHLVGLLDLPDKGSVLLNGAETIGLGGRRRDRIRCRDVGFVFQFYHLLPELSVVENALLPAKVAASVFGWFGRRREARRRAEEILARLGLKDRLRHRPKELSGGERQRVAIARALINAPKVLLADEPTGNLDSNTGRQIMGVIRECNRQDGQTILMVTHDRSLAEAADQVMTLRDGRLVG